MELLGVSVRGSYEIIMGFGLWLSNFGKGLRKQELALDGENSVIEYLNKSYL